MIINTILMNNEKELVVSVRKAIYQNENLVDNLRFLIPQTYGGQALSEFTVNLQYVTPANEVVTEELTLNDDQYKGMLEYILPIDTKITALAGKVQKLHLIFCKKVGGGTDRGKPTECILNTSEIYIEVLPSTDYRDFIIHTETDNGEVVEF